MLRADLATIGEDGCQFDRFAQFGDVAVPVAPRHDDVLGLGAQAAGRDPVLCEETPGEREQIELALGGPR